ncbi:MAG: hypothetical protein PHS16_02425 [Candidatus Colwellbacteria bacterium]|nr:hypothetical protein [Candidatus Colwellbacteria bacterium]MDD4818977.1 hypothetical protein [Candidatus Colwellbacteria bacterium]
MKNKLASIFGASFVAYFLYSMYYSYLGVIGEVSFGWIDVPKIFVPLIILICLITYSITRKIETLDIIRKKLICLYLIAVSFLFLFLSPLEEFFVLNITGREVALNTVFYLLEVVIFGAIGILVFMSWFKPVKEFLDSYQSDIKKISKENIKKITSVVESFSIKTAATAGILSLIAYIVGAFSLYLFSSSVSTLVIVNNLLVGLAISPIIFMIIYSVSDHILKDVNNILYVFGDITSPKRRISVGTKVISASFLPGSFFVAMSAALFLNFSAGLSSINFFYMGMAVNFVLTSSWAIIIGKTIIANAKNSLLEIRHGMELLESGNWDHRLNIKSGDEMELVAYEFNKMADELKKRCK